jgi:hypothetical protein
VAHDLGDDTVPGLVDNDPAMLAKHRARAIQALAHERCVTDLTDGFCGPRDGVCCRPNGSRDCVRQAKSLLGALESSGMRAVWIYDPALLGAK